MLHIWIGPDDMVRLTVAAIDAPPVHFSVVYGVSHTESGWWELEDAEALGYRPVLDVGQYAYDVENKAPKSEEQTSELQSLMRIMYDVFYLKKTNTEILKENTTS